MITLTSHVGWCKLLIVFTLLNSIPRSTQDEQEAMKAACIKVGGRVTMTSPLECMRHHRVLKFKGGVYK